jgi:hypothetical protein
MFDSNLVQNVVFYQTGGSITTRKETGDWIFFIFLPTYSFIAFVIHAMSKDVWEEEKKDYFFNKKLDMDPG